MMFNFPFIPYYRSRNYQFNKNQYSKLKYNNSYFQNNKNYNFGNNYSNSNQISNITHQNNIKCESKSNFKISNDKPFCSNPEESFLLDIFGLKLYYDDVLLLCLIIFLYTEGIKDDFLFIILILLLLS